MCAYLRKVFSSGVEVWEHYRPGRWVPHRTVSMRVPNPLMAAAVRRCLEVLPIRAAITGAAVTDHVNDITLPLAGGDSVRHHASIVAFGTPAPGRPSRRDRVSAERRTAAGRSRVGG